MWDNLLHQSISLMHVKDPLFKRMGASRISRFAVDGIFTESSSSSSLVPSLLMMRKSGEID
ncbi:hypothetical protein MKX03_016830 [Papaver bracteatum]|nr:hypothetical protein MKX03_016830 [Papaver bracteatum]